MHLFHINGLFFMKPDPDLPNARLTQFLTKKKFYIYFCMPETTFKTSFLNKQ